jgi:hypothetical protein
MMRRDHRLARPTVTVRADDGAPPRPARQLVGAYAGHVVVGLSLNGRARNRARRTATDLDVKAPAGEAAAG